MIADWTSLYEQPEALDVAFGHERIFAPHAYAGIRTARALPILVQEAALLAQAYPICFLRGEERPVLVVLLHLLPEEKRHLCAQRDLLPLVAQAYPYVVPSAEQLARRELIVDRAVADAPSDIGAPLVLDTGKLSKASLNRAKKAMVVSHALPATQHFTQNLSDAGFLEAWPLHFELTGGHRIDCDDFMVIAAKRLSDPALHRLVEHHGIEAGLFIGMQRLSLFRVMHLLNSAKVLLQREKPALRELLPQ